MGRWHLMELEDQAWFPRVLRDAMTDWLSFMASLSDAPFVAISAKVRATLAATGAKTIVELGAGGGEPSTKLAGILQTQGVAGLDVVLTDLYPNVERLAFAQKRSRLPCRVVPTSVDATAVPTELAGLRLFCNAFHHLPEPVARRCLADAVEQEQPIVVLEFVSRTPVGFLQVVVLILFMLLATPFVRPFRWSRLFFTYLVPLIPLATLWDGLVSCLRIYAPRELEALVATLPRSGFTWDIGRLAVPRLPLRLTYLIGKPGN